MEMEGVWLIKLQYFDTVTSSLETVDKEPWVRPYQLLTYMFDSWYLVIYIPFVELCCILLRSCKYCFFLLISSSLGFFILSGGICKDS